MFIQIYTMQDIPNKNYLKSRFWFQAFPKIYKKNKIGLKMKI